jgi:hypothetical protein
MTQQQTQRDDVQSEIARAVCKRCRRPIVAYLAKSRYRWYDDQGRVCCPFAELGTCYGHRPLQRLPRRTLPRKERISREQAHVLRKHGIPATTTTSHTRERQYIARNIPSRIVYEAQMRAYRAGVTFKAVVWCMFKLYAEGKLDLPMGQPGYPSGKLRRGHLRAPDGWYKRVMEEEAARAPVLKVVVPGESQR